MELHQLQCFMAVIEEGGFNRATTRLHITQPALSYQIKRLAEEIGGALFPHCPRARATVMYGQSDEVMDALLSNHVDLAVIANPRLDRRLNYETIIEERISLVCSKTHPLFGRSTAKPNELRGLRFISLTPETPSGQLIPDHLAQLGVSVDVVVTTPSVGTVKRMVEVGLGVAFLPDMVTSEDLSCNGMSLNHLARIEVRPSLMRRVMLGTWKKVKCSQVIQAFIDDLRLHGTRWKGCVEPSSRRH